MSFPQPAGTLLLLPYLALWLILIYFAVRLPYSIFRLLVALVFGPLALILYATPQTEWETWLWLRELVGWAVTQLWSPHAWRWRSRSPSLRSGLAVTVFSSAGLMAAHDLAGH